LAQAQVDVQKYLGAAMSAVDESLDFPVRWQPEELHLLAPRAHYPSVLYDKSITLV
jgi:hypothetical protein